MLDNILVDTLVTGLPFIPMFLGIYLVLQIRQDFDLTVEGSFAVGGSVTAVLLTAGIDPWLATAIAAGAGALAGLVTSQIHLVLRLPVLLAGLVMNMALFTVTLRILGMPTVSIIDLRTIFTAVTSEPGRSSDLAMSALLAAIVGTVLAASALFLRTELGLALRASGQNPQMVRSNGVNDDHLLILSLMAANGLSAMGGALMAQVQGFADVNMGTGMFVAGVGAVLLGVLVVKPSGSKVVRIAVAVLVGGLLYRLILVAALRAGLPAGDLKGITALTLILAVAGQAYLAPTVDRYRHLLGRRPSEPPSAPAPSIGPKEDAHV